MLPPDELDAGKRARAMTMCVRCVCRCIAGSRHLDLFQAPPREANEALVYATKQAQLESGLRLCIACSALQRHRTVNIRCTLHRRWGRTTPSRGTLTTAPSTRCAGDKPPQCIHPTPHQGYARTAKALPAPNQPWPCANPHHVLSPSDTSPSLTTRRARGDRLPLRPVSKGPDPRVPSPRFPPLTSRSASSSSPKV